MQILAHAPAASRTSANQTGIPRRAAAPAAEAANPRSLDERAGSIGHDLGRISVHEPRSRDAEGLEGEERGGQLTTVDDEPPAGAAPADAPPAPQSPQAPQAPAPQAPAPQNPAPQPQGPSLVDNLKATVPSSIRAASTQPGMPDRIPPRVDTPVAVTVTGWFPPMVDVIFSIEGSGGTNGSVTINGAATANLEASGTLKLRGVTQTDKGSAGNLKLVAKHGSRQLATSNGFSVSSVPQNWATKLVNAVDEPDQIGMIARNSWESDSKDVTDLDQVKRREQVEVTAKTGAWASAVQGTSSWKDATMGAIEDHHIDSPRSSFRVAGKKIANQVFTFKCERTGVVDIVARNSGLLISRNVTDNGKGGFSYTISKVGTKVTANGFTSDAASGSAAPPALVV